MAVGESGRKGGTPSNIVQSQCEDMSQHENSIVYTSAHHEHTYDIGDESR